MSRSKRSLAISQATSTRRQPSSVSQRDTSLQDSLLQKEQTIYFNLRICDISNPENLDLVEELQAGKTYRLAISYHRHCPEESNKKLERDSCFIVDTFSLTLSFNYNITVMTPIDPPRKQFLFDAPFEGDYTYEFTIPAALPACQVLLKLLLETPQRRTPQKAAYYTLPVHGRQKTHEMEIFKVSQINQRLPEQTAILLVETVAQHRQCIRLRGWDEAGQKHDKTVMIETIVSIEELQAYRQKQKRKALNPEEILNRLTQFSRQDGLKLLEWLSKLFVNYQELLNLIIVDLTDREFPWELLKLDDDLYLGACVRVVRWLPTRHYRRWRELYVKPASHTGTVISYLDQHLGPELIQAEQRALQSLAGNAYASLSELKKRLKDPLEQVGLIYIGCHGANGQYLQPQYVPKLPFKLEGLGNSPLENDVNSKEKDDVNTHQPSQHKSVDENNHSQEGYYHGINGQYLLQQDVPKELSSINLEGIHASTPPQLTVFLNACESARIIKSTPDDNSNFVEKFLAHCASGFIGTLVRVDIRTASLIAEHILLSAQQIGGVQIAEELRKLRKKEAEQLKHNPSPLETDYYRLIDTFMYVYYGNPLAHLQLHEKKESGE